MLNMPVKGIVIWGQCGMLSAGFLPHLSAIIFAGPISGLGRRCSPFLLSPDLLLNCNQNILLLRYHSELCVCVCFNQLLLHTNFDELSKRINWTCECTPPYTKSKRNPLLLLSNNVLLQYNLASFFPLGWSTLGEISFHSCVTLLLISIRRDFIEEMLKE